MCSQLADLCSPNPVQMLMLCVHLHERLPQYSPQQTIELSGGLHTVFSKQVTHTHTHTHTQHTRERERNGSFSDCLTDRPRRLAVPQGTSLWLLSAWVSSGGEWLHHKGYAHTYKPLLCLLIHSLCLQILISCTRTLLILFYLPTRISASCAKVIYEHYDVVKLIGLPPRLQHACIH